MYMRTIPSLRIIVAMVIAFESVISWMPMYGEIKLAFFVYLWYPKTKVRKYICLSTFMTQIYVQLQESLRGCDVFLVQPTCPPANENLMELLVMIDACRRASAKNITAVIPYFGYAKADGSGASSHSSSGAGGGGGDEEGTDEGDGGEYDLFDVVATRGAGTGGYGDEERGDEEEEERDLFGSDNEEYVKTPTRSHYLVPGVVLIVLFLTRLHSLSFFVLDEADRMIERGHFHELQSIIEMLPLTNGSDEQAVRTTPSCDTVPILQIKKRQTFVFSATLALSANFRKKLKRGLSTSKASVSDDVSSIEALSKQAGMKPNAEIVDLTKASILPEKLEESFIECSDDDKDAYLYYILSVHGQGRTIIFCTSIAALRHITSILRILGINILTNHAQMQQRARMKAVDRFRGSENSILVATDGFARGMDFDDVRTVIHYQLPHSTDVYIHRSGRTARKSLAGCSIALISPADKAKFYSLCKSLSKENLQQFPVDHAYMPAVMNRLSLARQIDKIARKNSQENANKSWLQRNAESMGLILEASDSEEERVQGHKQRKATSAQLQKFQQDLNELLQQPFQPKTFSRRYLAGAGVSPLLQRQLEELSKRNVNGNNSNNNSKGPRFAVIGQDRVEPLQALQNSGQEVCVNMDKQREKRRLAENWKRKKHQEKKCSREQKRNDKRKAKERE